MPLAQTEERVMKDRELQAFPDGHKLLQDKLQWIVRHPQSCRNARRGNLKQDYAKHTYFQFEENALAELRVCQPPRSAA